MRIKYWLIISILCLSTMAFAQKSFRFGLKVFPTLAWSRVYPESWVAADGTSFTYSSEGSKLRWGAGFVLDRYFGDNFALSTGINYYISGAGYDVGKSTNITTHHYTMQMLQLPLCAKFVSNEIADRLKVYVSGGFGFDYMLTAAKDGKSTYQKVPGGESISYSKDVNSFNINLLLGAGVEYELGGDFIIFMGLLYGRGMLDSNHSSTGIANDKNMFTWHNDYLALEVGVKF